MTTDDGHGGDPACWAHLLDAPDTVVAALGPLLARTGDGVHWSLAGAELHVNLVRLDATHRIAAHVNDELDVVLVILAGHGHVSIDGHDFPVTPHVVVHVPRNATREIRSGADGLGYLTVHRRPTPLAVRRDAARTADLHERSSDA